VNLKIKIAETLRGGTFGAAVAVLVGAALFLFPIGESLGRLSFDLPFVFVSQVVTNDVVIVKMDDASRLELNQTSGLWNRRIHARLLDKLRADQSSTAVFDVLFADPGDEADNAELARAIKAHGNVVLAAGLEPMSRPGFPGMTIQAPLKEFRDATRAWGITDALRDSDLTVRGHHPGTEEFPSLAWRAAVLAGAPIRNSGFEWMTERWIRYYGTNGTITTLSYHAALEKPEGYFKDKIVFIGGKPPILGPGELSDLFRTPYTRWGRGLTSGVEIHATIFLNLVRGDWLTRLSAGKEILLVVLAGFIFGYGLNLVRPLAGVGLALVGMLAISGLALWLFWHWNVWFSWVVVAGFQIPGAWTCSVVAHTMRAYREKEKLEKELLTQAPSHELPQPVFAEPFVKGVRSCAVIADHELLRCVGKGAYGEVWLARNVIGTYHAVKIVYHCDFSTTEAYAREFKGIQKYMPISLKHPGLVHILHTGRNDEAGYYYCIMEAGDDELAGQSITPETYSPRNLAKDLRKRAKIPVEECVSMTLALADALDFLHQQRLIHRDIKPSNIIFVNGVPKLADIGLVTDIGGSGKKMTYVGTEGYIAPEGPGAAAADIYSLGKVMYEASMGRDRQQFPELPTSLADRTDMAMLLGLNAIILKACEEIVRKRYQSASELRADLLDLQRRFSLPHGAK
jgi:CHASE2 domain-containing sensor protein